MRRHWTPVVCFLALLIAGCKGSQPPQQAAQKGAGEMALTVNSSAFADGAAIPKKYSCDGGDTSPPLAWTGVPTGTKSLALIMDDPDAPMGTWVHWVLWGMPPSTPSLPEGVPKDATLPGGLKQGINSFKRAGYGGPCPPAGTPHHYVFKLYALDDEPELEGVADKAMLEKAMKGHVLAQAQLVGTYGR